jgi:hypothetical protein
VPVPDVPTPMERMERIALEFVNAGVSNPSAEVSYYADYVDYYDKGIVPRNFIFGDIAAYDQKWPIRTVDITDGPNVTWDNYPR